MKILWKCLLADMKSQHGNTTWTVDGWKHLTSRPKLCSVGFHASPTPLEAISNVKPGFIAKVEVDGLSVYGDDKSCHQSMRVIQAWEWTKEDSVALAIFGAELVIEIFESKYPDDKRPRTAIEAAKAYLERPCKETAHAVNAAAHAVKAANAAAYAAYAADAAYAAYAAANAVYAAACAAADAAANAVKAANAAANAAAYAAANAAYAAYAAADAADAAANAAYAAANAAAYAAACAAARKTILDKCNAFIISRLEDKG